MDEQSIDRFVRAMAGTTSRQGVLRAVTGGAAAALLALAGRGPGASAHHGYAGPGDACRDSSQCGNEFPELGILYCADNGFASDGPLNCCRYEGGSCGGPLSNFDAACCGALRCVGGVCSSAVAPSGCTGEGCACAPNAPNPCDQGLICCGEPDGSGTCKSLYQCTGSGAPGDACPAYCLPGPTQCPSCVSGYCTVTGICG